MTRPVIFPLWLAVAGAALVAGGCGTTIEEAVPVSAETGLPAGPVDTGTYPNLNIRPEAATTQFSEAERGAKAGELAAARASAQGEPGAQPTTTIDELEALRQRPEAVRQAIESQPSE